MKPSANEGDGVMSEPVYTAWDMAKAGDHSVIGLPYNQYQKLTAKAASADALASALDKVRPMIEHKLCDAEDYYPTRILLIIDAALAAYRGK